MTMIDVIPQEFFDEVAVPPAVTLDGELLAALDEAPARPGLAEMLAGMDRSRLTRSSCRRTCGCVAGCRRGRRRSSPPASPSWRPARTRSAPTKTSPSPSANRWARRNGASGGGRSGRAASPRSARFARLASAPTARPLAEHDTLQRAGIHAERRWSADRDRQPATNSQSPSTPYDHRMTAADDDESDDR